MKKTRLLVRFVVLASVLGLTLFGCDTLEPEYDVTPKEVKAVKWNRKSIVFIIDTSGSMGDTLEGSKKIDSAKNSLINILNTYQNYNNTNHNIEAGLFCFKDKEVNRLVSLSNFNYELLSSQVMSLPTRGGTPLGLALAHAERELDEKATGRKFIVLLTDGKNTEGREPQQIFQHIIKSNDKNKDSQTELHIIAFNTSKSYFTPLENLGAKVYEAKGGAELMEKLVKSTDMILEAPE